ncbi:hypothetical protein LINPERHAP1_LOCUS7884 [Linum perenne]
MNNIRSRRRHMPNSGTHKFKQSRSIMHSLHSSDTVGSYIQQHVLSSGSAPSHLV